MGAQVYLVGAASEAFQLQSGGLLNVEGNRVRSAFANQTQHLVDLVEVIPGIVVTQDLAPMGRADGDKPVTGHASGSAGLRQDAVGNLPTVGAGLVSGHRIEVRATDFFIPLATVCGGFAGRKLRIERARVGCQCLQGRRVLR